MYYNTVKKFLFAGIFTMFGSCSPLSEEARAKGFVYLHEVDPTILVSLRYHSNENFVGKPVNGYKKSVVILTKQAAEALTKAQDAFKKDGYSLVAKK